MEMEYTKGEWKLLEGKSGSFILECGLKIIGQTSRASTPDDAREIKANAQLIAAAVNGCASVNPNNPLAVANSIKELYEALQALVDYLTIRGFDEDMDDKYLEAEKALAEVEGK